MRLSLISLLLIPLTIGCGSAKEAETNGATDTNSEASADAGAATNGSPDGDGGADTSDSGASGTGTLDSGATDSGRIDSGSAIIDEDGDGVIASDDCDDSNPMINPAAVEVCDGVDNNCDGAIDEDDEELDLDTATSWYPDADGDGFGELLGAVVACTPPTGFVAADASGFDCDDSDAAFYPGALEDDCSDPADYNCDGSVAYEDSDDDGWAACEECNDTDPEIHPDADEICDAVDNDCDGLIDDEDDTR